MVMAISLSLQKAACGYPRPHTWVVLLAAAVCAKGSVNCKQILHFTLLKQAKWKCEVKCKPLAYEKAIFIRTNLGLSEAATQSLARAHGVRS